MAATEVPNLDAIDAKLARLQAAIADGLPRDRCLRRWSEFIRERDGHRCVDCHSQERLSAHHICRKSFFARMQFQTGNGITLCNSCHKELHRGFNARPNMSFPVDAQGGEKLGSMERLFSILTDDAVERCTMREEFYFISDDVLATLKQMQGFAPDTYFPGSRIEQAYLILAECELSARRAGAAAQGMPMTDQPLLPGGLFLVTGVAEGKPHSMLIRTYVPRSKP